MSEKKMNLKQQQQTNNSFNKVNKIQWEHPKKSKDRGRCMEKHVITINNKR